MTAYVSNLSDRAQLLLKNLVDRYIRDGQPVGSKVLAEDLKHDLSPATIRNVLAELEERGLLQSLHASSGRIPTAAGYRLFVNHLVKIQNLSSEEIAHVQKNFSAEMEMRNLLEVTSSFLSKMTHLVGIVTLPNKEQFTVQQIEFLPLSHNRVLVILVLHDREVQNRILQLDRTYSASDLQTFANYLNQTYIGMDLKTVQRSLQQAMQCDRQQMNQLLQEAVQLASKALTAIEHEEDFVIAGQDNLLQLGDQAHNVEALCDLFSAFKQKQAILDLLNKCIKADGVQIFIGEESGFQAMDDYSVIQAPYAMNGQMLGVLGVIGPTRMPYDRVISVVDITAKLLTASLNQNEKTSY